VGDAAKGYSEPDEDVPVGCATAESQIILLPCSLME